MLKQKRGLAYIFISLFVLSGCVYIFRSNDIETEAQDEIIESPIKVHMKDGRTVLFRGGATFSNLEITGNGTVYSLKSEFEEHVEKISREEVAAYEVFKSGVNAPATLFISAAATAGAVFGSAALAVLIFGSCPTVYAATDSAMVLESELFSNSIAPIIEKRDVTDLLVAPDVTGLLQLEIRNEALETHYINHIELLEVSHKTGTSIYPDTDGKVYALKDFQAPVSAIDSTGRDLLGVLSSSDSLEYSSNIENSPLIDNVQWDTIDLEFKVSDDIPKALVFNLRNSLFTTVLLYDYLIASQGIESLDWIGKELETVSGAVAMGDFSQSFMGLRVYQEVDGMFRPIDRIPNPGPIAPRKIAVALEETVEDTIKIRLRFLSDSWRIDQIELATFAEDPQVRYLPVDSVKGVDGERSMEISNLLSQPDDNYVVTMPGNRFSVSFKTEVPDVGYTQSYLLAAQGYYTEWVREEWVQNKPEIQFALNGDLIVQAQQEWQRVKSEFEAQFFESKIPVR